jgi:hypothetical protein
MQAQCKEVHQPKKTQSKKKLNQQRKIRISQTCLSMRICRFSVGHSLAYCTTVMQFNSTKSVIPKKKLFIYF